MPRTGRGTIVIHFPEIFGIWINGTEYTDYVLNYDFREQTNVIGEFFVDLVSIGSSERSDVAKGKNVQLRLANNLIFKGIIERADYKTNEFCSIRGLGAVETYMKNATVGAIPGYNGSVDSGSPDGRPTYSGTTSGVASHDIISGQLIEVSNVSANTNNYLGHIVARSDHDNVLSFCDGVVRNLSGVWWTSYGSWPYTSNYFNVSTGRGTETSIKTFNTTGANQNANETSREVDEEALWTSLTVLGYGDGKNQLRSKVYHATDNFTKLLSGCTTSDTIITVLDSSVLPATGTVWVGMEQVEYTGKVGNGLTGCTRAYKDTSDSNNQSYLKGYAHSKGVAVFDVQYTETSTDGNGKIDTYGVRRRTAVDKRIVNQDALDLIAINMFEDHYTLKERIRLVPSDLYACLVSGVTLDDIVTVTDTESGLSGDYTVVGRAVRYKEGLEELEYELSNSRSSLTQDLRDEAELVKVGSQYMQGATTSFNVQSYENCDSDNPLNIRTYLPPDIIKVNSAAISFKIKDYRGYSDLSSQTYKITSIGGGSASLLSLAIGIDGSEDTVQTGLTDSTNYDISDWITSGVVLSDGNWMNIRLTPTVLSIDDFETGSVSSDWKLQTGDIQITSTDQHAGVYGVMMSGIASMQRSVNSTSYSCWFKQGATDGSGYFMLKNTNSDEIGSIELNYTEFRYRNGGALTSLYAAENNVWYRLKIGYSDSASIYKVSLYDANDDLLVEKDATVATNGAGIASGVQLKSSAQSGGAPQLYFYYWDDVEKGGQARVEANVFVKCFIEAK